MQELTNALRAEILTQALPYIQRYFGKIIAVKYGGNAMTDAARKQQVMQDVVLLQLVGVKVVLVHGGGPELSATLKQLGKQSEFVDGLRVTDRETADVAQMVLAGKVNKTLVNLLQSMGGRAMGLCGLDGGMIAASMKDERLGYVGKIDRVDVRPILDVLERGYIPVVSTIGADAAGNVYNINADTAAGAIAGALGAERLIEMTDVGGVFLQKDDPSTRITGLCVPQARELLASGIVTGGMIPKIECCIDAIAQGVKSVTVLDGRIAHALLVELLTDEGAGTMIKGEEME